MNKLKKKKVDRLVLQRLWQHKRVNKVPRHGERRRSCVCTTTLRPPTQEVIHDDPEPPLLDASEEPRLSQRRKANYEA